MLRHPQSNMSCATFREANALPTCLCEWAYDADVPQDTMLNGHSSAALGGPTRVPAALPRSLPALGQQSRLYCMLSTSSAKETSTSSYPTTMSHRYVDDVWSMVRSLTDARLSDSG
jgi:hypothetical protein